MPNYTRINPYLAIKGLPDKTVRVATTANITSLTTGAPNTLDGISLAAGDRILVKNQTTGSQNGIYNITTLGTGANGVWARTFDFSTSDDSCTGVRINVSEGTTQAKTIWWLTTTGTITLDTTALVFEKLFGDVTAITGLLKGSGGAIVAAVSGTDYVSPSGTFFIGTTSIAHNRSSASQSLTGITSIDGSAATLTTSRNIQGVAFNGSANIDIINGTGFVKASGTTLSYDNSTYLTTASAASTYQPLDTDLTTIAGLTATTDNFIVAVSSAWASRTPAQVKTTLALNNVENTALSTWAGSTNITTLGIIPNLLEGYTTTATSGGTTTLTVSSNYFQYFTGTSTHTVQLPVASTLTLGQTWEIDNKGTQNVTVNSSGGNAVVVLAPNTWCTVTCILTSGTNAASWALYYGGDVMTSGKKLSISNTLTLAGTDGTTLTFPGTSATIARTDAAQTFTGTQTFSSTISGSINGNAATVTTNANLTGPITSSGNATSVAAQTGTGSTFVMQASPTLTTPNLGTPTAITLTNASGLPISGLSTSGSASSSTWLRGDGAWTANVSSQWVTSGSDISYTTGVVRMYLVQNNQTGTTYTLVLSDDGKLVTMNNASAQTLTVPPNSSVAFPTGTQIMFAQFGAGQTTIAAGAGVTINSADSALKLRVQWSTGSIIKTGTDTWLLSGDLTA